MPSQWWPVTIASMLLLAFAAFAMVVLVIAIGIADRAPGADVPADDATPLPARAMDQSMLLTTGASVSPLPGHTSATTQLLSSPLEPTGAETPETLGLPTSEPTDTATLEPTNTPPPEPTSTTTPEPTATLELTNTPTLEPTDTPIPEPTSTPTPEPTATPTSTPIPVPDPRFRADRTSIAAGECTVLHWDVDGVEAVFLDGAGRPGHSSEEVCPQRTHTFVLTVVMPDGRQDSYSLDVQVRGSVPLTLNVLVTKTSCDTQESYAAEISIWAQGGDGWYTYYQDDLSHYIGGPTEGGMGYRISWRTCGGAPGTFIVTSGDGQQARQPFWVEPPDCCGEY